MVPAGKQLFGIQTNLFLVKMFKVQNLVLEPETIDHSLTASFHTSLVGSEAAFKTLPRVMGSWSDQ